MKSVFPLPGVEGLLPTTVVPLTRVRTEGQKPRRLLGDGQSPLDGLYPSSTSYRTRIRSLTLQPSSVILSLIHCTTTVKHPS